MKNSKIYPALVLGCICLIVALLLSGINMITSPIITERENAKANSALAEVLPGGKDFKNITADHTFPASIAEAYSADGGFVFRSVGKGRNGDIVVMVGVDSDGKVTGTKIISEGESKGYKEKVFEKVDGANSAYIGQDLDNFAPIVVAGATLSSNGYSEAIKAALQAFAIANGGSVDLRTPEQILQDTCNAALGTAEKTFTRWFATEYLVGIKNVYVCDTGVVMVIGDKYIGVNNDGTLVLTAIADGTTSAVSKEDKTVVNTAYTLYSATTLTEIDKPDGAKKSVLKVYKTDTNNYVFDMRASGNGINGEEWSHPSGEYILFSVCISADGKIIDVITTYQSESENYGDKCATDEYTEQFKGAIAGDIVITEEGTSSTSTDLGIISGSTITSNGYQRSLQQAFAAFELLIANEGGND